jgi:hypothetical protein
MMYSKVSTRFWFKLDRKLKCIALASAYLLATVDEDEGRRARAGDGKAAGGAARPGGTVREVRRGAAGRSCAAGMRGREASPQGRPDGRRGREASSQGRKAPPQGRPDGRRGRLRPHDSDDSGMWSGWGLFLLDGELRK